jgi:Dyp-type peroxidase family
MAAAAVTLEVADMQGMVASGYRRLVAADYVLWRITDAARAKSWLGSVVGRVTSSAAPVTATGVNLALTSSGLARLGLAADALGTFPAEFVEGIATPHRSRMLGDTDASDPSGWRWGGGEPNAVDALLMLFAVDAATLTKLSQDLGVEAAPGFEVLATLHTSDLGGREHFGFNDGISQPVVDGFGRPSLPRDLIATGEFVLGYPNEYGLLPPSPSVAADTDAGGLLPAALGGASRKDLGRNGTYLVFRQIRQDVAGFWNFAAAHSKEGAQSTAEQLAAKIVGRWPSGAPVVMAPDADLPGLATFNDFAYHALDADGRSCPIGAHVRRANPRDSLDPSPGSDRSVALVKRHRILRRGREYGPSITSDPNGPRPPLRDDGQERGLHFICLNANLVRQFEFVQATWVASPKFDGLYDDADPLVAAHGLAGASMDLPADPFRGRIHHLPPFVAVVGGGYFFLPGLAALRYLASL